MVFAGRSEVFFFFPTCDTILRLLPGQKHILPGTGIKRPQAASPLTPSFAFAGQEMEKEKQWLLFL
jgi:hypothetical protein